MEQKSHRNICWEEGNWGKSVERERRDTCSLPALTSLNLTYPVDYDLVHICQSVPLFRHLVPAYTNARSLVIAFTPPCIKVSISVVRLSCKTTWFLLVCLYPNNRPHLGQANSLMWRWTTLTCFSRLYLLEKTLLQVETAQRVSDIFPIILYEVIFVKEICTGFLRKCTFTRKESPAEEI